MIFWTKPHINLFNFFNNISTEEIEDYISNELFQEKYPVVFSSARLGIKCILISLEISRGENVLIPKYSSHCLWNSIGSIANPTCVESENISAIVSYKKEYTHYKSKLNQINGEIIYDAVDTFFLMNSKILEDDENYKVISLPKIIGSISGGVVFCKTQEQKNTLLNIRKNIQKGYLAPFLRAIAFLIPKLYKYWSYLEPSEGRLVWFFRSNIYQSLKRYITYQEARLLIMKNLDLANEKSLDGYLSILIEDENIIKKYDKLLSCLIRRNIFDPNTNEYKKCWLYPIHHQSDQDNYLKIKTLLNEKGVRYI